MIVDEFVNSRSKEIKEIEKSIETKKKQSLIWQRLPHYKRRRNRNYDKRHTKKVKPRKKDRHVLRTHTYFAKRFFMLKLKDKLSIPLNRRVKSDKFIYKFSLRLLVFDESFRGVFEYKRDEQTIEENSDLIVVGDKIISIGKQLNKELIDSKLCSFVLYGKDIDLNILKEDYYIKIIELNSLLEKYKIICYRNRAMKILNTLISNKYTALSLNELHRLSLENNIMTIYDNVQSDIYKQISLSQNDILIDKLNKTPKGKQSKTTILNLNEIYKDKEVSYFVFKVDKGTVSSYTNILAVNNIHIGHVIRSSFKFSSGSVYGLGVTDCNIEVNEILKFKNKQNHFYSGKIIKIF